MTTETKSLISAEWREVLSTEAEAAEKAGTLTPSQLDIVYREGWFRMFLPESLGGLNLSLPDGLRLEEGLARIDGSLGWTITLCSGATMFAGFMKPELAQSLLDDPIACFGGSGAPTGIAEKVDDHYLINGVWKYASGAPHLTAFTANCRIHEAGLPLTDAEGIPLIRAFVFLANEVTVREDWNTMGLRATAGHTFSVDNLRVPAERAFDIAPETANIQGPLFQYPFLPFAETTLAVNTLGMALHFLDCCEPILEAKALKSDARCAAFYARLIAQSRRKLSELRQSFYAVADASWESLVSTGHCTDETQQSVGHVSRELARGARDITQHVFPYCGMAATNPDSTINRIWRDLFTASQHSLLNKTS